MASFASSVYMQNHILPFNCDGECMNCTIDVRTHNHATNINTDSASCSFSFVFLNMLGGDQVDTHKTILPLILGVLPPV